MKFLDELTGFGSKLSGAVSPYLSLASGIGSLFGNKNIDKQIKAQQEENQKNREYNLMLAQMQNEMSQDQWERENEYNLPINQRKRLEDAGLNADLIYGNGGIQNVGASSPAMTSGAPSSPADMSPLGQKKTIGDMIRDAQATRLAEAQIKQVEANTRKTNADADMSEKDLQNYDVISKLGIDLAKVNLSKAEKEVQNLDDLISQNQYKLEQLNYEVLQARRKELYADREMEAYIKQLESQANISASDAKYVFETLESRILGVNSQSALPKLIEDVFGDNSDTANVIIKGLFYLINAYVNKTPAPVHNHYNTRSTTINN